MVALEVVGIPDLVRVTGGTLGTRVGGPDQCVFPLHQLEHISGTPGVINLPVPWMIRDERLILASNKRPIDGLGEQDVVMSTQVSVGFLTGQDEEVTVRVAAARLEVVLQFLRSEWTGILRMTIAVEVEDMGDVDAHRTHQGYPRRGRVEAPGVHQLLRERRVEVRDHRLVAGQRLEPIAVRERHDRIATGSPVVWAHVEVDRHPLQGAGRGVVEGEHLLDPDRVVALGALPLADSQREGLVVVLAGPDVAEIHLQLACEEELVRRREECDRAVLALGDSKPVPCSQDDRLPSLAARDLACLWMTTDIMPEHPREQVRREAFQPTLVDVGD